MAPHLSRYCLRIGGTSATGAAIEPKTSKNLPTGGFFPGRPGLRQHGQEHGARRLRGSEALMRCNYLHATLQTDLRPVVVPIPSQLPPGVANVTGQRDAYECPLWVISGHW